MPRKKQKVMSFQEMIANAERSCCIEKKIEQLQLEVSHLSKNSGSGAVGQIIAVIKYGFDTVTRTVDHLSRLPLELPPNTRIDLCSEFSGFGLEEIKEVIDHFTIAMKPSSECHAVGPPTSTCLMGCLTVSGQPQQLETHHKPTKIRYISALGPPSEKLKIGLRCSRCGTNYDYDKYGTKTVGYRFYPVQRDAVAATDVCLIDRKVYNQQWAFSQHAWVSFEGFAESWNDAFSIDADRIDRRIFAKSFWWGELEQELRDIKCVRYRFSSDADMEDCMKMIDFIRSQTLYPHTDKDCSPLCKARGCGKLWVTDGIWKLQFAHCMFKKANVVKGLPLVNYPDVCTEQPMSSAAFCVDHCKIAEGNGVPTGLKSFLKYAGVLQADGHDADKEANISQDAFLEGEVNDNTLDEVAENHFEQVDAVLSPLTDVDNQCGQSVLESQVGKAFIKENEDHLHQITSDCVAESPSVCNKDTGQKQTLRKMSRGHQFIVRAGGHIETWTPLYQSESTGQVFLILISWLYILLGNTPQEKWNQIWLAYDNMCNLIKLKAAQMPLPLQRPFNMLWLVINKIIDALHLRNHKDKNCRKKLHPDNLLKMFPELKGTKNTMAGEQTFVWLSRFKKIVCSMPKVHHLFFLHRLVKRRNNYTSQCFKMKRNPLLPKLRNGKSK